MSTATAVRLRWTNKTLDVRMLQPRYVIAFIVACLILAAGAAFCAHARQSFIKHLRQKIEEAENADETAEELAMILDQGIISPDIGFEVSCSMLWRLQIANLLAGLWYVWVIVAFGACFAAMAIGIIFAKKILKKGCSLDPEECICRKEGKDPDKCEYESTEGS